MGARVPPPSTRPPWGKGRQDASACSQGLRLVPLPLPLGRCGARSCPWAHTRARHTCTGWALPHSWRLRGRICFASSPDSVSPTRPLRAPPAARQLWSCRCTSSSRLPRPVPPAPSPTCPSPPSPSCSPLPCSPPPGGPAPTRGYPALVGVYTPDALPSAGPAGGAVGRGLWGPAGRLPSRPAGAVRGQACLAWGRGSWDRSPWGPQVLGDRGSCCPALGVQRVPASPAQPGSLAPLPPASLAGRPRPGAPVSP